VLFVYSFKELFLIVVLRWDWGLNSGTDAC
jgi:hypothetical protein